MLEVVEFDNFAPGGADEVDEGVGAVADEATEEGDPEDVDSTAGTLLSGMRFVHFVKVLVFLKRVHRKAHRHQFVSDQQLVFHLRQLIQSYLAPC